MTEWDKFHIVFGRGAVSFIQGHSGCTVVASGIFLQAEPMPLMASKMKQGSTKSDAGSDS